MTKQEQQTEALARAVGGLSSRNYAAIIEGFAARGIHDAEPRRNVFTYAAWRELGRQVTKRPKGVEKGEWGIPIVTFIACTKKGSNGQKDEKYTRPKTVHVFHVSQTEAMA